MENLTNIKEINYTLTNKNCSMIFCCRIGKLLFINLQILYNTEILPGDSLVIFENIDLKYQNISFALKASHKEMADLIRLTVHKNKVYLNSNTSPNGTNKYGHGYLNIVAIVN